jgi:hypothetical protein
MASLMERAIGAAKLDPAIYEEVEHDPSAMGQAVTVVVVVALAAGIGAATNGIMAILLGVVLSLVGWCLWAAITWIVGTRLFGTPQTEADFGQLFRTLGFAASPGVLQIFGVIPVLGIFVGFASAIWQLATMVVAVRQALDYDSTGRAIAVCVVGFFVYLAFIIVVGALIGGPMMAAAS